MPRTILLLGESIPWGWATAGTQNATITKSATAPGAVLERLLAILPPDHPWAGATVVDLAVPNANTRHWATGGPYAPPMSTTYLGHGMPALDYAVAHNCSLTAAANALCPTRDVVLFMEGIADKWSGITGTQTRANMLATVAALAPTPVLLSGPVLYPATPTPFQQWSLDIRAALQGITNGPTFGTYPPRPYPGGVDPLHLTDGGYIGVAGLWYDAVTVLP